MTAIGNVFQGKVIQLVNSGAVHGLVVSDVMGT